YLFLANMQGGEFSPSGKFLYVSSGSINSATPADGINVFDTSSYGASTWKVIEHSTNRERCDPPPVSCGEHEHGPFSYSFDNDFTGGDTPEGLTIWDLDDGRAPGVGGQLHALVFSHNYFTSDTVTLFHFGRDMYVNPAAPAPPP